MSNRVSHRARHVAHCIMLSGAVPGHRATWRASHRAVYEPLARLASHIPHLAPCAWPCLATAMCSCRTARRIMSTRNYLRVLHQCVLSFSICGRCTVRETPKRVFLGQRCTNLHQVHQRAIRYVYNTMISLHTACTVCSEGKRCNGASILHHLHRLVCTVCLRVLWLTYAIRASPCTVCLFCTVCLWPLDIIGRLRGRLSAFCYVLIVRSGVKLLPVHEHVIIYDIMSITPCKRCAQGAVSLY